MARARSCANIVTPATLGRRPTPRDTGGIGLDLGQQLIHVRGWIDQVVEVPAQVAVLPVENPPALRLDMAEPRYREPSPLRAKVRRPGRPALQDRDRPAATSTSIRILSLRRAGTRPWQ